MDFTRALKIVTDLQHGQVGLDTVSASQLFGAMLDGGIPELELGALLVAFHMKPEDPAEMLGFYQALEARVHRLSSPVSDVRPVLMPSHDPAGGLPNFLPLLALLLARMGVPVLVHGSLAGDGGASTAAVFRELGVAPCTSLGQVQGSLERDKLAFVPTAVLAPGLAHLLSLRSRLGFRNSAHFQAQFVDPFLHGGMRIVRPARVDLDEAMREFLLDLGEPSLLLADPEGGSTVHPHRRPRIEFVQAGRAELLFEAERHTHHACLADKHTVAKASAVTTEAMLSGRERIPWPILNQLACCLYASGYTEDFNQAKAIAAMAQPRGLQPIAS